MADIRIKDLPTTATQTSSDDFIALDGTTNGTRKLSAYNPSFGGAITGVSLTAPTTTNLTLAGGSTGASLVLGQGVNGNALLNPAGAGRVAVTAGQSDVTPGILVWDSAALAANIGGGIGFGGAYTGTTVTQWASIRGKKLDGTDGNFGGYLAFFTRDNGGPITERSRISATGNLLIGTTNDSGGERLVVTRTVAAAALATAPTVRLTNATGEGTFNSLHFAGALADAYVGFLDSATAATRRVAIGVNSLDTLSVNGNGNVLIGTTTDGGQKLQVAGTASFADGLTVSKSINGDLSNFITNVSAGAAAEANLYVSNGGTGATSVSLGVTGTGYTTTGGFIQDAGIVSSGTGLSGGLSIMARAASSDIRFYAGSFTNLVATFASTGAATFAGAVNVALTGTSGTTDTALNLTTTQTAAGSGTKVRFGSTTYAALAEIHGGNVSGGQDGFLDFYVRSGGSAVKQLAIASTGAATFAGAVTVATNLTMGAASGVFSIGADTRASDTFIDINTAAANSRLLRFQTAGISRWQMGASSTAEGGANAGSNFVLNAYSDAGALLSAPLFISRSTGAATFAGAVTASSNVKMGSGTAVALGSQFVVMDGGSEARLQINSTDRPGIFLTAAGANVATLRGNTTTTELLTSGGTPLSINNSSLAATFAGAVSTAAQYIISGSGAVPTASTIAVGTNGAGTRMLLNVPSAGEINFNVNGSLVSAISSTRSFYATQVMESVNATPSTGAGSGALQVAGGIYAGENSVFAGDRLLARKDQNAVTRLQVRNDTSGTSAQSQVSATLGDFTTYTAMGSLSAGFTTSGLFAANAGYIASNAAAGLNLFTVGATSLTLGTNSTAALTLASTGAATFAGTVKSSVSTGSRTIQSTPTVTVAPDAVQNLVSQNYGFFLVNENAITGSIAIIGFNSGGTYIVWQEGTNYSATANTASKFNVYYSAGTQLVVQNKKTSNATFNIINLAGGS